MIRTCALTLAWFAVACAGTKPDTRSPDMPGARAVDGRLIAQASLGASAWRESCSATPTAGLCLRRTPPATDRCNAIAGYRVIERDASKVNNARAHFRRAMALWNDGMAVSSVAGRTQDERNQRAARMLRWLATARFLSVEDQIEAYLATPFPAAQSKVAAWAERMGKRLAELTESQQWIERHLQVKPAAPWMAAAAMRVAQLNRFVAEQILTAPIPERTNRALYCASRARTAKALLERAAKMFRRCMALDSGGWHKWCAAALRSLSAPSR